MTECKYYSKKHPDWAWTGDQYTGLIDFKQTFLESQFDKKFPQKTQKIFVGSMSEIAHWEQKWIVDVIHKIEQCPQHIFQFLTRYPGIYREYNFPKNCWLGITITNNKAFYNMDFTINNVNTKRTKFISIEPILKDIDIKRIVNSFNLDWIIIGAETGNRKNKIIPKKEWIENIVNYCRKDKIPVYLKDSLKDIYSEEIKEFPI